MTYAQMRLRALLAGALLRALLPGATLVPVVRPPDREAPPAALPAPVLDAYPAGVRVGRAVATSRAMVQAANALAAMGEDVPSGLWVTASYEDGMSVLLTMQLLGPGEEVPDGDDA